MFDDSLSQNNKPRSPRVFMNRSSGNFLTMTLVIWISWGEGEGLPTTKCTVAHKRFQLKCCDLGVEHNVLCCYPSPKPTGEGSGGEVLHHL